MRFPWKLRSRAVLVHLVAVAVSATQPIRAQVPNTAGKPASQMDVFERTEVEKLLAKELQQTADTEPTLPGQKKIVITTTFESKERRLVIDLGRDAVPDTAGAASERQCHSLVTEAISILKDVVSVNGYTCKYGGKDIFYYHPDPPAEKSTSSTGRESRQVDPPVIVMVSAGHGYFYNPTGRQ